MPFLQRDSKVWEGLLCQNPRRGPDPLPRATPGGASRPFGRHVALDRIPTRLSHPPPSPSRSSHLPLRSASGSQCGSDQAATAKRCADGVRFRSDHLDPIGFRTFLPRLFSEANPLVLPQGAQPSALDRTDVDENVLAALIGGDEAKALVGVEPLHSAFDGSTA